MNLVGFDVACKGLGAVGGCCLLSSVYMRAESLELRARRLLTAQSHDYFRRPVGCISSALYAKHHVRAWMFALRLQHRGQCSNGV